MIPSPLPGALAWIEVDLDALASNFQTVRRRIDPATKVLSMVKANAYGHGAVEVARALTAAGTDALGVATLEEGLELRQAGITTHIVILGMTDPANARTIVAQGLTQMVCTRTLAEALAGAAAHMGATAKVHVKVDTGMGRLGIPPEETVPMMRFLAGLPSMAVEGVYTHFATAPEKDKTYSHTQFTTFTTVLDSLQAAGLRPPLAHAANSATIIEMPHMQLDMVRPGLMLYGLYPSDHMAAVLPLTPVLALRSRAALVKTLTRDHPISYGRTYTAPAGSRIATIPVGYADGISRKLANRHQVLIRGTRRPIVGRVCMDQFMVDVTPFPDLDEGEPVTLIGRDGNEALSADDMAVLMETVNYEVVCLLGRRLPRVYLREGAVVSVHHMLEAGADHPSP